VIFNLPIYIFFNIYHFTPSQNLSNASEGEIKATAAVEYLNPLQQCTHEATIEEMIPNVVLWRYMHDNLKSEYRKREGFDFFEKFSGYTGYALPSGYSPG
jgi:hypothetical protein